MALVLDQNTAPLIGYSQSAVDYIDSQVDGVEIVSVLLNQRENPDGSIWDVMDVGFKILGVPGTFFVHPPADLIWEEIAVIDIQFKVLRILGIYAGMADTEEALLSATPAA